MQRGGAGEMGLGLPGPEATAKSKLDPAAFLGMIDQVVKKFPQIKIIALTSFADENMVQGALQAGAIGYLQKNITAKERKCRHGISCRQEIFNN